MPLGYSNWCYVNLYGTSYVESSHFYYLLIQSRGIGGSDFHVLNKWNYFGTVHSKMKYCDYAQQAYCLSIKYTLINAPCVIALIELWSKFTVKLYFLCRFLTVRTFIDFFPILTYLTEVTYIYRREFTKWGRSVFSGK